MTLDLSPLVPRPGHMPRDPFVREQRLDRVVRFGEQFFARDKLMHRVVAELAKRNQSPAHFLDAKSRAEPFLAMHGPRDQVMRRRRDNALTEGATNMRRG